MASMFKSPKQPDMPKIKAPSLPAPVRMPMEDDPTADAAAMRTRSAWMKRKGRQSTILTANNGSSTFNGVGGASMGSSGQKLGA